MRTTDLVSRRGVAVLSGYGLRIAVERGHLVVEDGIADKRRRGRFSRIAKLKRLIVLGHAGTVTLDALRFLYDIGAAFVHIDTDGRVITASGPAARHDPRVLRAQVLAKESELGLAIAQQLIREKLDGQRRILRERPQFARACRRVTDLMETVDAVPSFEQLRLLEADAAGTYWDALGQLRLPFSKQTQRRIPDHWMYFGHRTSPLTGTPRKAANPAQAMLNYLYAVLEAEARIAALAMGCDPDLGIMHADLRYRPSFACDLMEPIRPKVDAFLLAFLGKRRLLKGDFFETRDGTVRVLPPLSKELAETAPHWRRLVAPVAERVAHQLEERGPRKRAPKPTPLTQKNRSAGRRSMKEEAVSANGANRRS